MLKNINFRRTIFSQVAFRRGIFRTLTIYSGLTKIFFFLYFVVVHWITWRCTMALTIRPPLSARIAASSGTWCSTLRKTACSCYFPRYSAQQTRRIVDSRGSSSSRRVSSVSVRQRWLLFSPLILRRLICFLNRAGFITDYHGEHIRGSECDQKILSKKETSGHVVSPNFPYPYIPKVVCRYFIYGMQDAQHLERVRLEFLQFAIQMAKGE